jgi:hypothetical protein
MIEQAKTLPRQPRPGNAQMVGIGGALKAYRPPVVKSSLLDPKDIVADSMTMIQHLDFNDVITKQLRAQNINSSRASVSQTLQKSDKRQRPGRSESQTLTHGSSAKRRAEFEPRASLLGSQDSLDAKGSLIDRLER